jgi:hypothetical protein
MGKTKIMNRKVITLLVSVFCVLCLQGCATKREGLQEVGSNKEVSTQGSSQNMSQSGGVVPSDETRLFRGEVGDLKVEMRLVRAGERLSGTYAYEKVGTSINLSGTIDAKGKFTLQESDSSGKQTGVFKGTWDETVAVPTATLDGNWTKAGSGKELSFYLTEQHVDLGGGSRIVTKSIKEEDKKNKYTLAAEYPQLEGSTAPGVEKFNQEVSGFVNGEVNEWKKTAGVDPDEEDGTDTTIGDDLNIRYDVRLATNDLASIEFMVSTYEHGAAHPMSYSKVVNYDLKQGRALQLADLFQPGANYLEAISTYSINELKRRTKEAGPDEALLDDASIEEGAAAKADNYGSWNITRKGLLITFDAYQVGPYAAGPQWVVVPYSALREIIRADGPLAPFVR